MSLQDRLEQATADPRIESDHLRLLPGEGDAGDIVLVGAVHDHPASVFRAKDIVERLDPAVVAVELPGLAVPLFERYARALTETPNRGGEMSSALGATETGRGVGIDTLGPGFLLALGGRIRRDRASRSTIRQVASDVLEVGRHALACRLAALDDRFEIEGNGWLTGFDHDVPEGATPAVQADHERRHLSRSQSFLRAVKRPHANRLVDETREEVMASNLDALRNPGTVVAVVGFDHLDSIAALLEA